MEKFIRLTAKCCPLLVPNVNTDQILPARYLKWPRAKGLGSVLFHDFRRDAESKERADFPLNNEVYRDAKIILAGRNFGGGSSREAAVYALYDYGFRCVIAPSFGDIFAQNAVKNGLLAAVLVESEIAELAALIAANPTQEMDVDLERRTISWANLAFTFVIDPISRNQLLNGWDDIDLTDNYRELIASFRAKDKTTRPWVNPQKV